MKRVFLCLLSGVISLILAGCGDAPSGSGLSKDQESMVNNLSKMAKESDGDWDKLSQSQKDQLIKSAGTEEAAKNVLKYSAHPPAAIAPGAPGGGKPGGPPPGGQPPAGG